MKTTPDLDDDVADRLHQLSDLGSRSFRRPLDAPEVGLPEAGPFTFVQPA